jgi:ribosomal protein S3AE
MQHHPCQSYHPLQHVIVDKGSTVKKPAADAEILKHNEHNVQEVTQI